MFQLQHWRLARISPNVLSTTILPSIWSTYPIMAISKSAVRSAVIAGSCAAGGSVCGKLSGMVFFPGSSQSLNYMVQLCFLGMMLLCNAFVWKFYATALQSCSSSLPPTLISTASNYIISALSGCMLFGETTSLLWWSGSALIFIGLGLVTTSRDSSKSQQSKKESEKK
nr:PREDICTED: uncharacterized protein LOC109036666 [Bemisia tabaci]